ncbi:MAG: GNAT family N-acetyltransferase [Gammaproteobacteria bacterium]|nr:GNAT family N-acetyltransferase [Gammaproteobacteria bacterium]
MTEPARIDVAAALSALPGFPELPGRRVCLRGPRSNDADALLALFSDPAVMRYWSRPPMTARSEAEGLIAEILDAFEQRAMLNWVVVGHNDLAIGTCTLFHFDPRHRHAEVGYCLRSEHWGKGLAREAVMLALDWGFRTLGLHRIEASIDPCNDASRALLQRLGFTSEGVLRERYYVGEIVTDSEIFGLLADDWRARAP